MVLICTLFSSAKKAEKPKKYSKLSNLNLRSVNLKYKKVKFLKKTQILYRPKIIKKPFCHDKIGT